MVGARQLRHADDIAKRLILGFKAGVPCDVVGACHDVHNRRPEGHYVRSEADQHLRRSLAGDAAADEVRIVANERLVRPPLGDRIADKYNAAWVRPTYD